MAAAAPKPMFLMARGETGLETLIDAESVNAVPHFPEVMAWEELMSILEWVRSQETVDFKTLCLDTINAFERLCHEYTCVKDYQGDWGPTGFESYQNGPVTALSYWREMLNLLDKIREKHRTRIICLAHAKVSPFKNPEGENYDRYSPDMHHKTWGITARWGDTILFQNFFVTVTKDKKGQGGQQRVMYTTRTAAFDAKNRLGLPDMIPMGTSGESAWQAFSTAAAEAVKSNRTTAEGESSNG